MWQADGIDCNDLVEIACVCGKINLVDKGCGLGYVSFVGCGEKGIVWKIKNA